MYERLDRLRDEVKRCEKRRDDANERLKAAQAKLKEAEASQILSDVGALKLSPEEVAKLLQMAASGKNPGMAEPEKTVDASETENPVYTGTFEERESDIYKNQEDEEDENY